MRRGLHGAWPVVLLLFLLQEVCDAKESSHSSDSARGKHRGFSQSVARRQMPTENALLTAIDHLEQGQYGASLADNNETVLFHHPDFVAYHSGFIGSIGYAIIALGSAQVLAAGLRLAFSGKRIDEGLDTGTILLLSGAYISIASASDVVVKMQTQAHGGVMPFSPSRMVFVVELVKLVITMSVVLVKYLHGTLRYPAKTECARATRLMVVPAVSYSVNNAILLMVVSHVDFSSLSVWRQLTPLFVAVIWIFVFRRHLGRQRWAAIVLLLCGTAINTYPQSASTLRWNPLLFTVLGSCCSTAIAGVANEYVLKQCARLDLDFLCIILYLQTTALSFFFVILGTGWSSSKLKVREDIEWTWLGGPPLVQEPAQIAIIALQVLFGFTVARVIRYLGAIPRAVMNAMKELTVVIIAPVFVASQITTATILSVLVVGSAAAMFSTAASPEPEGKNALHVPIPNLEPREPVEPSGAEAISKQKHLHAKL